MFAKLECTRDRQVDILVGRLGQEVSWTGAVNGSAAGCSVPDKRSVIEPTPGGAYRGTLCSVEIQAVAAPGVAHEACPVGVIAIEVGIDSIEHGEWEPAMQFQNRRE